MRTTWDECKQIFGSLAIAIVLWAVVMTLTGCSGTPLSTREKGTLAGGAIGAGTGAIVGSAVGAPGAGAAIGGALGAGTGLLVGNELQNQEVRNSQTQAQVSAQQREINSQRQEINRLKESSETE
ncbi:MAG TPA: glycine zipper domain-containing protein [Candidatus Acidoferrales bacterium]|nr:glycine zipper domain-containing protein [Candidatus Acidoferrales bacterium]